MSQPKGSLARVARCHDAGSRHAGAHGVAHGTPIGLEGVHGRTQAVVVAAFPTLPLPPPPPAAHVLDHAARFSVAFVKPPPLPSLELSWPFPCQEPLVWLLPTPLTLSHRGIIQACGCGSSPIPYICRPLISARSTVAFAGSIFVVRIVPISMRCFCFDSVVAARNSRGLARRRSPATALAHAAHAPAS